jgi:hypothetical protein
MKKLLTIVLSISMIFVFLMKSYAWGPETHKIISIHAALWSNNMGNTEFFKKLNLERGPIFQWLKIGNNWHNILGWMQYGAEVEDDKLTLRSNNHFHNPLKSFNDAGLSDIRVPIPGWTPLSLILWAQDSEAQSNVIFSESDNSWKKVREWYYNALKSSVEKDRNEYFAEMFKGLGHQVHLIQDASVPEHVRNDW